MTAPQPYTAAQLWRAATSELEMQMTRATYSAQIAPLVVEGEDAGNGAVGGELVLRARNERELDWVEHRLKETIERTVTAVAGQPVQVRFVLANSAQSGAIAPNIPEPPRSPIQQIPVPVERNFHTEQVIISLHRSDPTRPYLAVPHYAVRFWSAYLGATAFRLWELLASYGFFVDAGKDSWPTIRLFGDILGVQRSAILGRAERGEGDNKRPAQDGAAEVLARENIIRYWTVGSGRQQAYRFAVAADLSLLVPAQVVKLPISVQAEHKRFLENFSKSGFDLRNWIRIETETMMVAPPCG